MLRRAVVTAAGVLAASFAASGALAQDTIKIGIVQSLTGQLTAVGKQIMGGVNLYVQQKGNTLAGKKIELIVKDDTTVPDVARRLAQELIVNDKVNILGTGITPATFAIAPLATQAKIPGVIMVSGTSAATERSPYLVRTSFTLGQQSGIIAEWAAKNGSKKVVIVQSDWAPGAEATAVFTDSFKKAGGEVA